MPDFAPDSDSPTGPMDHAEIPSSKIQYAGPLPDSASPQPGPQPSDRPRTYGGSPANMLPKLLALLILLVVVLLAYYVGPRIVEEYQYASTRGKQRAEYDVATEALKSRPLEELSQAYQWVSQRVAPSVVHISTRAGGDVAAGPPDEVPQPFGPPSYESHGQGSGVIVDQEGYILTNWHVVRGSSEIQVTLSDRRVVQARVVGVDRPTDLALLRVGADRLIAAEWGDSEELKVGSLVWAVGSPFGLRHSVTAGIVSAMHRETGTVYQDFLQTDAAVNPGNSGGPLVDSQGRVVGINTAIVGQTYQGISFAIPSKVAQKVYERLKNDGRVPRGWFGVQMEPVPDDVADQLGMATPQGALVSSVVVDQYGDSPAKKAGIQVGDIVIRWDGNEVDSPTSLSRHVANTDVGAKAEVVVLREGEEMTLEVQVGERPRRLN